MIQRNYQKIAAREKKKSAEVLRPAIERTFTAPKKDKHADQDLQHFGGELANP